MREKRHAARRAARTAVSSRFVVLTGLSGSGKSQAIRALEDLGYFCVDNLPVALLPMLAELTLRAGSEITRAAVVVDVREGRMLDELPKVLLRLRRMRNLNPAVIFLDAQDEALVRRFSETRRPHPLARNRSALEGIREERKRMRPLRRLADHVVDTSKMTVHEHFNDSDQRTRTLRIEFGIRYFYESLWNGYKKVEIRESTLPLARHEHGEGQAHEHAPSH